MSDLLGYFDFLQILTLVTGLVGIVTAVSLAYAQARQQRKSNDTIDITIVINSKPVKVSNTEIELIKRLAEETTGDPSSQITIQSIDETK